MMSRCQEKGRSALHRDHTYMWGFRGSEGQPFLNLVAELSGVRSGLMFLSFLAMVTTFMFTGMDGILPWKSLEASTSYDPKLNASVNDTNMTDILSHDSDVALSDQDEILQLLRDLERLLENSTPRDESTSPKRDLQSFPEDGSDYNGTGKSLVLYGKFRVKTQDGSQVYDSQQLRDRIKRLRERATVQHESRMPLFKRAQDMNMHLRSARRLSRRERRMQARSEARSKVRSHHGWVQRMVANKWLGMVLLFSLIMAYLACMMPGAQHRPQGFGHGPRQHAHVGDAGPPFLGTATLKVPPAWSVERNQHYSLRSWISDLIMWSTATDVEPQRMGPIAALQVSGSAKELVREIPPDQLANGGVDPVTGNQITGLMMLVQTLARRYMPLEQEMSTRAISDFMNFDRIPGESIDALLVRFDVLRARAQQRGGFGINHGGLSWILLRSLRLNAEQTDRLLQFIGGALPHNDAEMGMLIERIRRQGHLFEGGLRHPGHQAGVGDPGNYHAQQNAYSYFPTFGTAPDPNASAFGSSCAGFPPANAAREGMAGLHAQGTYASGFDADMERMAGNVGVGDDGQCSHCGLYFEDDDMSSATESDTGSYDADAAAYATVEVDGQTRHDDDARANALYQDYVMARRRWRRYTGKPPRRYRRFGFKHRPRFQAKLDKGPYARTYSTFLPQGAFAGGKGKGKGNPNGFRRGPGALNPRGKDGQIMKCAKCGSTSHLWRKCPQVVSGNQVSGSGTHWAQQASAPPALALMTNVGKRSAVDMWPSASAAGMPGQVSGVAFHYLAGSGSSAHSQVPSEVGFPVGTPSRHGSALDEEMLRLESASQVSSQRSQRSQRSRRSREPPAWDAALEHNPEPSPEDEPSTSSGLPSGSREVQPVGKGSRPPMFPPPNTRAPDEDQLDRQRSVLELSSLLQHAWWEGDDHEDCASKEVAGLYHQRTRLEGNRVGLLVDPGAHDNLVGGLTADRMAEQVGTPNKQLRMSKSLQVEGVGQNSQSAEHANRITLKLRDVDGCDVPGSFTAPVIQGSALPPLLGLRSLRQVSAVLDTKGQKLYLPGAGGLKIECSPGTRVFDLELSPSGHLVLPIDHNFVEDPNENSRDASRLDFAMSVRDRARSREASVARSKSPAARGSEDV